MQRLLTLKSPINEYLGLHPNMASRGLSPQEWVIVTEVCSVLKLMKYVNTAIQGGPNGFLCNTLIASLESPTIEITDYSKPGATAVEKPMIELHDISARVVSVAVEQLNEVSQHQRAGARCGVSEHVP